MDEKLREEGYALLMELAKDPDYLISLAKIGAKARESGEKLKKAIAPEPRFYKGQPVKVKSDMGFWKEAFFIRRENGKYEVKAGPDVNSQIYDECKPDPDAVSLPNWIEHDGSSVNIPYPKNHSAVWVSEKGHTHIDQWREDGFRADFGVIRYCIIPLPEFIVQ